MAKNWTDKFAKTAIGGRFFKNEGDEDYESKNQNQNKKTVEAEQLNSSIPAISTTPYPPVSFTQSVDEGVRAKIQQIADQTDQVSYTKFKELITNMRTVLPDEESCHRAAFAAGMASNLTPSEVLRGVDAILSQLTQAEQKFKMAAPQRIAEKVGSRRAHIQRIQQAITDKQNEMQRLQEAISRLNVEVNQLSQNEEAERTAILHDEKSVNDDVKRFSVALSVVRVPYLDDRQKIELYGFKKEEVKNVSTNS